MHIAIVATFLETHLSSLLDSSTMPKKAVVDFMRNVEKKFEVEKGTKLLKALIGHGVDLSTNVEGKQNVPPAESLSV